jgi:hypothetical protein
VIPIYCHFITVTSREAHEKEIIFAIKEAEERVRADAEQSLGLVRAKLVGTSCTYKVTIYNLKYDNMQTTVQYVVIEDLHDLSTIKIIIFISKWHTLIDDMFRDLLMFC